MALYGSLPGDSRNMAENQECSPGQIMNAASPMRMKMNNKAKS